MNLKSSQSSYRSEETLSDAITRIMDEEQDWLRIMNLEGDKLLSVYLDMKSPHAYIAVRPTLEVARDYRVKIDFRPYTLSYTSLGLTTSLEDNKRQPPTPEGDRKARMYYATGRQYAALQKIPFRAPYRLLDSELANRVFLFAKQQGLEIPFIMDVFLRGWGSGWRDYEIESLLALRSSLIKTGADTDGLDEFVAPNGPGQQALMKCAEDANNSGLVGVPHFVFHDVMSDRQLGLFGREHLALLRFKLSQEGLARNESVRAEFSHAWDGP